MKLRLTQLLAILPLAATMALQAGTSGANTFTLTGSMNVPRDEHMTVLLDNGEVLAVTGDTTGANSAELYDPAKGKWTFTGTPVLNQDEGTATVLADGEVLLAGGFYRFDPSAHNPMTAGAELYNPSTGEWTLTGSLASAREFQSAVLLPNGQVLAVGGEDSNGNSLADAELYDPATGTWQPTASMHQARRMAMAELLGNGTVLVAGGMQVTNTAFVANLKSAEIYDPSTAEWTMVANMPVSSTGQSASLLNGDVLVTRDAFFDPGTGTWTATPTRLGGRLLLGPTTATTLTTGAVLLTGFENDYNGTPTESYTFLYNFGTNGYAASASMNSTRFDNSATLLFNGQVLVSGGFRKGINLPPVPLSSAELYTP